MTATPEDPFWSLVGGVLVVNLDDRGDRWEDTQQRLSGLVPAGRLRRLSAVAGVALPGYGRPPWFRGRGRDRTWAGRAGCALSHRNAIQLARDSGWPAVLILEDDLEVSADAASVLAGLGSALATHAWDACYLGYTDPVAPYRTLAGLPAAHRLCRISGASTTHAYLLRDTTYDWLLQRLPAPAQVWPWISRHRAIDRWYYRNLSRRFSVCAVSPSLIVQQAGFSDITQRRHERVHSTAVPDSTTGASAFGWLNRLRHLAWRLADGRDALRGLIKQRRGF